MESVPEIASEEQSLEPCLIFSGCRCGLVVEAGSGHLTWYVTNFVETDPLLWRAVMTTWQTAQIAVPSG